MKKTKCEHFWFPFKIIKKPEIDSKYATDIVDFVFCQKCLEIEEMLPEK